MGRGAVVILWKGVLQIGGPLAPSVLLFYSATVAALINLITVVSCGVCDYSCNASALGSRDNVMIQG